MEPKILVVDDDPDIITVLQDRLEAQGYEILTAGDGLRALELIEQDPPRLMLLDLEMPRLNGLELLKRLAEAKGTGTNIRAVHWRGTNQRRYPAVHR